MPFSFPSSPSIGDKSTQNSREYEWSGYAWEIVATPAALSASVITSGTFDAARLPLATTGAAGAVIVGTGLGVSSGTVSVTYGTTSGTSCQGNDSRLSDTRTPTDGTVTTAKIADANVTYAKIQNVSATDRLLGRSSAGAGVVEEITCTSFARSILDDASAADVRSTLSVQPTASPAFTGAATFTAASGGSSVPVTITNEGTGNSFVVNDAPATDSSPFVIDADGRVIIGGTAASSSDDTLSVVGVQSSGTGSRGVVVRGSAPSGTTSLYHAFQSVAGTAAASFTLGLLRHFIASQGSFGAGSTVTDQYGFFAASSLTGATNNYGFYSDIASGSNRWNFYSNGTAANYFKGASTFDTSVAVNNTGNVVPLTITNAGTANSFVVNDESGDASPFVIDASGNVGIGATPGTTLDIQRASADAALFVQGQTSSTGATLQLYSGAGVGYVGTRNNYPLLLTTNNAERLRIDSSGVVNIVGGGSASAPILTSTVGSSDTGLWFPAADVVAVSTAGTERVRVDAGGNALINTTSGDPAGTNQTSGCCISPSSYISITRSAAPCLYVNRKTDDGTIVSIHQDGTAEGSISVAGNTVSYNAFCGSHWAQLIDGSRPSILRGTVLETIDEMCAWPEGTSERLARVQVSATPASRRVYGVFMAWDEEYAATGDMYAAALGAYMVRVSGVVQSGDLLESAGDGTARAQSDDLVRSSTIGKVSSTHRVAEYDDGSYLVPCVLMCG